MNSKNGKKRKWQVGRCARAARAPLLAPNDSEGFGAVLAPNDSEGSGLLARFHRDERGDMLDYALVFAFIAIPLMLLFDRLFDVLADYFGMIAYYVTWPFL